VPTLRCRGDTPAATRASGRAELAVLRATCCLTRTIDLSAARDTTTVYGRPARRLPSVRGQRATAIWTESHAIVTLGSWPSTARGEMKRHRCSGAKGRIVGVGASFVLGAGAAGAIVPAIAQAGSGRTLMACLNVRTDTSDVFRSAPTSCAVHFANRPFDGNDVAPVEAIRWSGRAGRSLVGAAHSTEIWITRRRAPSLSAGHDGARTEPTITLGRRSQQAALARPRDRWRPAAADSARPANSSPTTCVHTLTGKRKTMWLIPDRPVR
jgi:hypothetical protein